METAAVYAGIIAAGTVVVLAVLKVVERIDNFPRNASLFVAALVVGLGFTKDPTASNIFYYLGLVFLAAGLPPRWGIFPAVMAAIAPLGMYSLGMVSMRAALALFAIGGTAVAYVGAAYWWSWGEEAEK